MQRIKMKRKWRSSFFHCFNILDRVSLVMNWKDAKKKNDAPSTLTLPTLYLP